VRIPVPLGVFKKRAHLRVRKKKSKKKSPEKEKSGRMSVNTKISECGKKSPRERDQKIDRGSRKGKSPIARTDRLRAPAVRPDHLGKDRH